jgi:hypothetical protein
MAIIKIPSSNIYGFGDNNSLFVKNKITQAELSVNSFSLKKGSISESFVATYYLWDEETMEAPVNVEKNPDYNSILFRELNYFPELKGVVAEKNATFKIQNPINITPNANGYVNNLEVVRNQNWLCIETAENTAEHKPILSSDKIIVYPQMLYNQNKNTFSFSLELDSYNNEPMTIVYRREYWDGSEENGDGFIGLRIYYLLSETINVEGLYYSAEEVLRKYASSIGNSITLPTNELVQEYNTLNDSELLSETLLENVVNKYSRGKEVYELKCSLANYYDEFGFLAICPTESDYPATFKKYDIVEPYIYTSTGEVPLSARTDGTPKSFEIIGIDFEFNGVVWQKITIQEYID